MSRTTAPAASGQSPSASITKLIQSGEDELLSPDELATILKKSTDTLQRWREQGRGPKFTDVEGEIRYRRSVVDAYLEARTCQNTAQTHELRKAVTR